jgi:voltage-gated potassium channel
MVTTKLNWRRRLHLQLDPTANQHRGLTPTNRLVVVLIVLSVVTAILESEPDLSTSYEPVFRFLEVFFGVLFGLEYIARLVVAPLNPQSGPGLRGVLRYARSPVALLDLLALSPVFFGAVGMEAYVVRLVRLARVLRLARLGRFSSALGSLRAAVASRRYELLASVFFAGLLLVVTSVLLYLAEGDIQPDRFGSIPRAMWWSIVTLTTVGYGDVYPVTPLGKLLAGGTALVGIGLIAMPTGILAAAFSDAMQRERREHAMKPDDGPK